VYERRYQLRLIFGVIIVAIVAYAVISVFYYTNA
jgi:hypothetical protein